MNNNPQFHHSLKCLESIDDFNKWAKNIVLYKSSMLITPFYLTCKLIKLIKEIFPVTFVHINQQLIRAPMFLSQ